MLPSVRLLDAARELRARMGVRGPDPNHPLACLDSTVESPGSSGPVSPTVVPYSPSIAYRSNILTPAASCDGRSSINSSLGEQRPDDARGLVGERDRHQHARLPRQHLLEPGSAWCIALSGVQHNGARSNDEQAP